ncbi:glycosyltransferase [Patiriisocius sp. Uisw_017]|uniref:glycosyltransferase n=1 Tax=Patiriisocius sp. Uisw_017 TaxID=3230968 RepID=UPI0039E97A8D
MKTAIIIPIHNEEAFLEQMLTTLMSQTKVPAKVVLVNDNSTDNSQQIIDRYSSKYAIIESVTITSSNKHEPGSKVVNAFYAGYDSLTEDYDLVGKFDADILLPKNYFESIFKIFTENENVGLAGGNLYIQKNNNWFYENISEKTKVRGPIKLYRKACFEKIGGLKTSIGWDTVDGLLAIYHNWEIATDTSLQVKHLRPTGESYSIESKKKQGEAFYRMRYSKNLARLAAIKLAIAKNDFSFYLSCVRGYEQAKQKKLPFIVNQEEGTFINTLRWQGIKKKLL